MNFDCLLQHQDKVGLPAIYMGIRLKADRVPYTFKPKRKGKMEVTYTLPIPSKTIIIGHLDDKYSYI